jgi:hypothetical protein
MDYNVEQRLTKQVITKVYIQKIVCLPILDILITRDIDGTLLTSIYRKPSFSGI